MIDDDMRLLAHYGKGCACSLHMAEFNRPAGTNIDREELYNIIMDKNHKDCMRFRQIFEESQEDSLKGTVILSSDVADRINKRGFGKYTGVEIKDCSKKSVNFEIARINGKRNKIQFKSREIVPVAGGVEILSEM